MKSLPKGLPKKIKLFVFGLLLFSFLFGTLASSISATHNQSQLSSDATHQTPQVDNTTTSNANVSADKQGEVKGILIAVGIGVIVAQLLGFDVFGAVGDTLDCATNFQACVASAFIILEDAAHTQLTGCSAAAVVAGDESCPKEKINAALKGVDNFSDIPNPGLLDYLGYVGTQSLTLPVPINSGQYFASINPFSEVRAAGAEELANNRIVLDIWQRVRNVAYALSAVVLMLVGFMIMLRWRLDPRTVVTIQNSLPRIVISLILITFSFAISGFMIDITRVVTQVVISLVPISGEALLGLAAIGLLAISSGLIVIAPTGPNVGAIALFLLILALILAVMILIIFVILIYKLLKRYIIFLLLTIFAPFFFLAGALPGGEGLIFNWFKRQAAALLAIPFVALTVNLSFAIGFSGIAGEGNLDFPSPWPVVGGIFNNIVGFALIAPIIGIGLFFFATKVPDIVDEMFGIKEMGARKGIGPGAIIGAPLAAASTVGTATRAAPMVTGPLEGWAARGGTGSIGNRLRGGIAGALYSAARPFDRRGNPLTVKQLREERRTTLEKDKKSSFSTWNQKQEAAERAAQRGVSSGPKDPVAEGETGFSPDRKDQQ